ncbi:MAG: peptidase M17 [Bacteroidetes bacterium]|nr:MAG: peptidase M17 [Bacteroidota bacterium]
MELTIKKALRKPTAADTIYLVKDGIGLKQINLSPEETEYIKKQHRAKQNVITINRYKNHLIFVYAETLGTKPKRYENYRSFGNEVQAVLNGAKVERAVVHVITASKAETLAFVEGMALGNYQFLKYFTESDKKRNSLTEIDVYSTQISDDDLQALSNLAEAVYKARDLVNTPVADLNAEALAAAIVEMGKETGAKVDVFNKKKIESLKMGGLLAVNRGSIDEPTFTTIQWKPANAVNKNPYVFVGKGVVYDTGGLSLKPGNYMDTMKSDMAGAAAVATALYAISKAKLPVYVIGLIPATDNRPDGNAYTPGDVITMFDNTTVEVLNTDAEGRMILADALAYAKKFNPELVIDIATLTGAAARAIGPQATVGMQVKADTEFNELQKVGNLVHERIVEFPMWDEYKEQIKSEIADLKNIGGPEAGAITAGKFLEHFTDYPYIHLDIAAPSFLSKRDKYRPIGGTGVGVRLFFEFIKSKVI